MSSFAKRKPYYLLLGVSFLLLLVIGAFFTEEIAFFNPNDHFSRMSNEEYFVSFAAYCLALGCFLFLAFRHQKIRVRLLIPILLGVLFISQIIAVLSFPSETSGTMVADNGHEVDYLYVLDGWMRTRYILSFLATVTLLWALIDIFPQVARNSSQMDYFYYVILGICFVAIFYSLLREGDSYTYFFDRSKSVAPQPPESFFNNRNTYSSFLLFGISSCFIMQDRKRRFYYYIIIAILFIAILTTFSKTAIIIGGVAIIVFLIYRYIKTFRGHWIKNNIALASIAITVAVIVILALCHVFEKIDWLMKFVDKVVKELDDTTKEDNSFESRVVLWNNALSFINSPLRWIFGLGNGNASRLFGEANGFPKGIYFIHNGALSMLFFGGIIRLLIWLTFIGLFIYVLIKNLAKKQYAAMSYMIVFLLWLVHGLFEDTYLLGSDSKELTIMGMCVIPSLIDFEKNKLENPVKINKEIVDSSPKFAREKVEISKWLRVHIFFYALASIPLLVFHKASTSLNTVFPFIGLAILLLLSPLCLFIALTMINDYRRKEGIAILWVSEAIYLIAFFLMLLIRPSYVGFIVASVLMVGFFLFVFIRYRSHVASIKWGKLFLEQLPLYLSLLILGVIDSLLLSLLHNSAYLNMALLIANYLAFFMVYICSPLDRYIYPIKDIYLEFEIKYLRFCLKRDEKILSRQNAYHLKRITVKKDIKEAS